MRSQRPGSRPRPAPIRDRSDLSEERDPSSPRSRGRDGGLGAPGSPAPVSLRLHTGFKAASDHEVMAGVQAGEACALEELVARFWDPLVSYAVHVLESTDAAEDVVQETFARVWRRRGHWDSAGSVSAFLYVTTRRLALNERRRLRRRRLFLRAHRDEIGEPIQPAGDPSSADVRHAVDAAIASLPARQREIFTLARFHRLTHAEIAETLGISPATVSNHMTAALRRLRVLLEGARTPD